MANNKNIPFELANIKTLEFAVIEDVTVNPESIHIGITLEIGYDLSDKEERIKCGIKFQLSSEQDVFIVIHMLCSFDIDPKAWKTMYDDKLNAYIVPKLLMQELVRFTVGATRGALHAKTENTPYNKYFLPRVTVEQEIKEDVILDSH